jgi:hypothetical protein
LEFKGVRGLDGRLCAFIPVIGAWMAIIRKRHRISGLDLNSTSDFLNLYNADAWCD